MVEVVALGEILIDFAQKSADGMGYPALQAQPGGAPANFLAALAKYGHRTAMIGKVGDDAFGHLLVDTLEKRGISTAGVVMDSDFFTTLAFVTLDENGERSFSFARKPGADTQLTCEETNMFLLKQAKVFHFGTLSLTDDPAREATEKCLEYAKNSGKLISFDPNLRLPLWDDPQDAKQAMLYGLEYADVVKISDEEVDFLWGCNCEKGAQIILQDFGASLVYVTLGAAGCYFANRNGGGYVKIPQGITPVDTTGAGDIFGGSAMHCLLCADKNPDELTTEEMEKICRFACRAASLSTESNGGLTSVPDKSAVDKLL
ncbi:MAG: carbohydrate kinase [Oscillospiraceae bacterium]|nr:carbohydrate kinase [Oscillospiraceae bacterium]